jgi:FMN reductase (NADPH)
VYYNGREVILPEYDEIMQHYYQTRLTNNKDMSWTGSVSRFLSVERRMYMQEVVKERGFFRKK